MHDARRRSPQRRHARAVTVGAVLATVLLLDAAADVQAAADSNGSQSRPGVSWDSLGGSHGTMGQRDASGRAAYVVSLKSPAAFTPVLHQLADDVDPDNAWHGALNGFSAMLTDAEVAALQRRGDVAVEPDGVITAYDVQTDAPWNLDRIDQHSLPLDGIYAPVATGAGVDAYVLDSGVRDTHTEFTGRIQRGAYWDFHDGGGETDCAGHGTHVAGTLGGTTYGVAKQVTIIPVKVLDCTGTGLTASIIAGINWVINDHVAGQPAVANFSLGGYPSQPVDDAVRALIADGVTVVAAAGNEAAPSCLSTPGRVPEVITVAASESDDDDADYSNFGPCNDLFAPGTGILSASIASDTASTVMSGTSMAAPHVAGAAALLLQSNPTASPAEIASLLDATSTVGALSECCGDPDKLLYVVPGPVTLTTTVVGTGTITSSPGGIACGSTCAAEFPMHTPVTLTATPSPGAAFTGWSGACTGPSPQCVVALDTARAVTASFSSSAAFVAVTPGRLLDTRLGPGMPGAGSVTEVAVAGRFGVPVGAVAAALNITITEPSAPGYATVFPCGSSPPTASNVNYGTAQTIPNAVIAALAGNGTVCVFTSAAAHLVVDVDGWFTPNGGFGALSPARLMDTRQLDGIRRGGGVTPVHVAGAGGVGASPSAVALNVTVTGAQDAGYVAVFPCGSPVPLASNLNYAQGQTIANAVVAAVGSGGDVCLFTSATTHLVVDVNGWFGHDAGFGPLVPARLVDTREGAGARAVGTVTQLVVAGRGGVPASATAVVLNVTVTQSDGAGFVTVYPCGSAVPLASNLNVAAGSTIPNAVFAKLGDAGSVCLFTSTQTHVVVDVNGWFL